MVSDIAVLIDAVNRIAQGESVVDPTIVSRLMQRPRSGYRFGLGDPFDRERDVLALKAEGHYPIAQSAPGCS